MSKTKQATVTNKPKATVTNKSTLTAKDCVNLGAVMATEFMKADSVADSVKQGLLLASAKTHAGSIETVKAILTGYFNAFVDAGMSNNSAKTRKSEARRVYEAVAITQVSQDNYNTLEKFNGGYHEFIGLARDLCNAKTKSDNAEKATSNRKPVITEKQEAFIHDKLSDSATIIQLSDFVQTATESLNAPRNKREASLAEKHQFILINSIANSMMSNEQYDAVTKKVASEIFKLSNVQINRMQEVEKKATQATQPQEATA